MIDKNKIINEIKTKLQLIFKDNLQTIIVYGSFIRNDYIPKISDLNILIVLKDNNPQNIRLLWNERKWLKKNEIHPMIFTRDYILNSLDSFPLEFLEIKEDGKIIYGDDFLNEIIIQKEPLRIQCERELKQKTILLRSIYLNSKGNKKILTEAISRSYNSLRAISRGVLFLKNIPIGENALSSVASAFELDYSIFENAQKIKGKTLKLKGYTLYEFFELYVKEIQTLQTKIDKLE